MVQAQGFISGPTDNDETLALPEVSASGCMLRSVTCKGLVPQHACCMVTRQWRAHQSHPALALSRQLHITLLQLGPI